MTWEIIDDKGVIFSGSEDEMRNQLDLIESGECLLEDARGDLKLVQVHYITRQYHNKY